MPVYKVYVGRQHFLPGLMTCILRLELGRSCEEVLSRCPLRDRSELFTYKKNWNIYKATQQGEQRKKSKYEKREKSIKKKEQGDRE
jgi:hypothetical protein